MLGPTCNSSICVWEMWRNVMIFSGVIKPTAVVINRGHSLLRWANASHNFMLSFALSLMTSAFVSRPGLWTPRALTPALNMIHLQSMDALTSFLVLLAAFEAKMYNWQKQNPISQPLAFFENGVWLLKSQDYILLRVSNYGSFSGRMLEAERNQRL